MVAVGVGHVAIGVSDIERSIEFYRDVVGFDVYLDRLEAMPLVNRDRRAVYMRNQHEPYSTFIVLDAEVGAEPFGEVNRLWGLGVHHFAFWTTDVEDATGKARAKGHEIVVGPVDADSIAWAEPAGTTIRTVLMKDPDGNIVQLDERCS